MYNNHFGLERAPFKITPDTSQFYSGGDRGSVLEAIAYAIESGEGIVKVIGEVGTGKTMTCRMLQLRLPENVELVYIANPNVSAENILNVIAIELKVIDEPVSKLAAQNALQEYLLSMYSRNKRVVIFVEEAQGMPLETLEEIRMLTNLETDTDKLLQIVLFGQPELDENLDQPSIRQLKERIAHNFYLKPLKVDDIKDYLNFRTRNTGYHGPDLFSEAVSKKIGKYSKGLIRRVNIIADKAMLSAYADGTNTILPAHVKKAVADSDFDSNKYWRKSYSWLIISLLALALLASAAYFVFNKQLVADKAVMSNLVDTSSNGEQIDRSISVTPEQEAKINNFYLDDSIKNEYGILKELGFESLSDRLVATHDWLSTAADNGYTIQLMVLRERAARSLEGYLDKLKEKTNKNDIYVYETMINGKLMYGVLYKQFADKEAAKLAIKNMPSVFDNVRPVMLRSIKGIRDEVALSKI